MTLPLTKEQLCTRLREGQRTFDPVNLSVVYHLENEGVLELDDATQVRFESAGVYGRVVVRLTPRGKEWLHSPGS